MELSNWFRIAPGLLPYLAGFILVAGCTGGASVNSPAPSQLFLPGLAFSAPSDGDCRPPSPEARPSEVMGAGLWALAALPIKTGNNTKIVWRMGGHGAFQIGAKATDGTPARFSFGPEPHESSSWNIPNTDEWGTGMTFPKPGCWRVHASRTDTSGDVYFLVAQ